MERLFYVTIRHMQTFVFDIETLPAPESSYEVLRTLYDKKCEKEHQKAVADGLIVAEKTTDELEKGFADYVAKTSFDGAFGRVLCIAYGLNDMPIQVICNPDDEKKTLQEFWRVVTNIDLFIGHNIMEFDLRFLLQRSIILGVKPSWNRFEIPGVKPWDVGKMLSFARYRNNPIFDTMQEWSNWGNPKASLEHLAYAMGIPTPKGGGIDGSQVNEFFLAGKVDDICEYCKRDVDVTRKVYQRMRMDNAVPF
jgi:3'-5' exonuclease